MKFLIPDATGHTVLELDKADPEDLARAAKMFDELVKEQKNVAYTRNPGEQSKLTREHDPNAEETVFFRPLQGG